MAHQTEIVVNGQTVEVTEFDHTAQEIDDMCDAAQSILPDGPGLPVSQGGTGATTPQAALAALGAGVRPNLLINPFFRIDQRNKGTYNSSGYTLDGWCNGAGSDGTITQNPDGAEFSIVRTGIAFYQPIDATEFQLSGKKVTFSILYSGGAPRLSISRFDGSWHHYTTVNFPASENMVLAMVSAELGDLQSTDQIRAAIYAAASNTTFQVYCAKLEVGDTQTLAYQDNTGAWQLLPQPESDYATQLTKCQRYYLPIDQMEYRAGQVGTNYISFSVPTPVTMRTNPVLAGTANIKATNGTPQSGFAISFLTRGGIARAYATKNAHGLTDAVIAFESGSALSAEL